MIISKRVTVGTAAIQLVEPHNQSQSVKFVNAGTEVVRIGGDENVDATNAYGLARLPDSPNTTRNIWEFELNPGEAIWGIVGANSSTLNVWIQQK
jgi:hypothetical protein